VYLKKILMHFTYADLNLSREPAVKLQNLHVVTFISE